MQNDATSKQKKNLEDAWGGVGEEREGERREGQKHVATKKCKKKIIYTQVITQYTHYYVQIKKKDPL